MGSMITIHKQLKRLSESGFTTLPLDQAQEAFTEKDFIIAFKVLPDQQGSWSVGVLLILGNLSNKLILLPDSVGPDPDISLGFCGQTLIINQNSHRLNDLLDIATDSCSID